ncbi:TetR/AcrR family transcriptional regulator [Vibrio sp.]|uniref:TetR/AcrR family transcriptional regulator n=1 Tax=Vibrio sp. TaxID=678 RepID=UPI003AA8030F
MPEFIEKKKGSKNTSSYHHDDLRSKIILTGVKKLKSDGIQSITLRGIAAELGVSRTAPYRHFKDKHALLCAIASEGYIRFTQKLKQASDLYPESQPQEKLQAVGKAYYEFAAQYPEYYKLMFSLSNLQYSSDPELEQNSQESFQFLCDLLLLCQKEGVVKQEDVMLQAHFVWASLHGYCSLIFDQECRQIQPLIDAQSYFLTKIITAIK